MSAVVTDWTEALVRKRDAHDWDSPRYGDLDLQAFVALFRLAQECDLRGLEFWANNGPSREGLVIGVEDDPERGPVLTLDAIEGGDDEPEQNVRVSLIEALACGWLQEPGEPVDPDSDGYPAMSRALQRRRAPS